MFKKNMTKNAIITGGSRGIGKAIALAMAKAGVNVVLTYQKNKSKALAVVKEIEKSGHKAMCVKLNQKNREDIRRVIRDARKRFGEINILVNNAAVAQKKPLEMINDKDWDNVLAINLRGPFIFCQEILPYMKKQGWGRIVNISSIGGQWGGMNQIHYAAAKAGLINLTKSVAKLYSKYGITSNAVAPGLVATDMTTRALKIDVKKIKFEHIPIGRIAIPEEIASVVAFLCSEEASYITGQTININGGMLFN
jgi:acetoacetyl-CoA reductase/3-oxoacyl-[acyl-carrier protein] reductase